jgi:hypothetical protein
MSTKTYLLAGAAVLSLANAGLAAADGNATANGVTASVDFLWLSPGLGDTYYVTNSPITTTFPNGVRENNEIDSEFAYRLALAYDLGPSNRRVRASYTHLDADNAEIVSGDFLWATVGRADFASGFENYAGTAASAIDLSYDSFDLLFSEPLKWSETRVSLLYGLEYADVELDELQTFDALVIGTVSNTSDTDGIGPKVGFSLDWDLFKAAGGGPVDGQLSLNVLSTASLLLADSESSGVNVLDGTTILSVRDESTSRVIPAFHMRAGLAYDVWFSSVKATVAAGYEFQSYVGAIGRTTYPDDVSDGLSNTEYENLDLSGPYAGLALKF